MTRSKCEILENTFFADTSQILLYKENHRLEITNNQKQEYRNLKMFQQRNKCNARAKNLCHKSSLILVLLLNLFMRTVLVLLFQLFVIIDYLF